MKLGTGLTGVVDYSSEVSFVDAFRASRPWIGTGIVKDANGWVTSWTGAAPWTLMNRDIGGHYLPGQYTCTYTGTGALVYSLDASLDSHTPGNPNVDLFTVSSPSGAGIVITLPAGGSTNIKDIRVLPPGGICSSDIFTHVSGAGSCSGDYLDYASNYDSIRFLPQFLDKIRRYDHLRFMDWMVTNNSTQSTWANRPEVTDAQWSAELAAGGVPLEMMIELCNKLNRPPWFNIPHLADNDYVSNFAALVKANLNSNLDVYVEYSNECWNGGFSQQGYCQTQGVAEDLDPAPYTASQMWYSKRAAQIHVLFRAEFPGEETRVRRMMCGQAVSVFFAGIILEFQNNYLNVDEYCVAPYIGSYLGDPSFESTVQTWTLNDLFNELNGTPILSGDTSLELALANSDAIAAKVATYAGVKYSLYEGGQHLVGYQGVENNTTIEALFKSANRDSRMGDVYDAYLPALEADGITRFAHFQNCGVYTKFGSWGALEFIDQTEQDSPKYAALMEFIEGEISSAVKLRLGNQVVRLVI
jgi:hypothetical protein